MVKTSRQARIKNIVLDSLNIVQDLSETSASVNETDVNSELPPTVNQGQYNLPVTANTKLPPTVINDTTQKIQVATSITSGEDLPLTVNQFELSPTVFSQDLPVTQIRKLPLTVNQKQLPVTVNIKDAPDIITPVKAKRGRKPKSEDGVKREVKSGFLMTRKLYERLRVISSCKSISIADVANEALEFYCQAIEPTLGIIHDHNNHKKESL